MRREPRKRPPAPDSGSDEDPATRSERRRAAAEHRKQIKDAKRKLRSFKPTLGEIAAYAGSVRRAAVEKSLELGGVACPRGLPAKIRTLIAAIESGVFPTRLRLVAAGALAYFMLIADLIPDMAPLGLADDLIVADVAAVALMRWRRSRRSRSRRRDDPDQGTGGSP